MNDAENLVNAIHGAHKLQLDRLLRLQLYCPQVVMKR